MKLKTLRTALVIWLCTFLVHPCTPALGFTIGEERKLGEQLLFSIRRQFTLLDDPDISQYINELARPILEKAGPRYFDYHFFVVRSSQFNAFAAPSGLIFFYTGLLESMKNEDELVSVMAHEIAHTVRRHIASRLEKQSKVGAASMLLGLASLALGNPALSQGLLTGSLAASQAVGLSFSRQDEEEADRLSFDWMRAVHRDPRAMVSMLRTMRRITRYRMDKIPPYLLTHPNPEARLDYVQSLVEIDPNRLVPGYYRKTDNFAFLRFKYRVLLTSKDPQQLRTFYAGILSSSRPAEERIMARYGLALLDGQEHDFTEAESHLEAVRAAYPDREILLVDQAVLYLEEGKKNEALQLLRQAHRRNPADMYATFQLARALAGMDRAADAEQLYNLVAASMPEYSKVYYELARLKSVQGRDGESYFYLGKYYLYEGKLRYANQYLQQTSNDKTVPERLRQEALALLAKMKELKEPS